MRRWRFLYALPWLLLMTQCAGRAPKLTPAALADAARAEALVRDGCYTCLQEAAGIYARLMEPATRKSPERVVRGAFDTAVLLALREKELGLTPDASLARARELAPRLPQDLSALLGAAEAVFGDVTRLDSEERLDYEKRQPPPVIEVWSSFVSYHSPSRTSQMTAAYVAFAAHCEQPRGAGSATSMTIAGIHIAAIAKADSPNTPPLLRYRVAICSSDEPATLRRMREADPRWAEIAFFEGKYEMGSPARAGDPDRAAALLTQAAEAFPDSIAIRLMLANAHDRAGTAAAALENYDRVLAARPNHVDARLRRVENLSYLSRSEEAIAGATQLIDAGTWHVGDAYYWRAWNRYQTRQVDAAWADVRQALSLLSNTAVYALAGSIAYARGELDTAVTHFDRAFEIDPSNCLAKWSAGLAHVDRTAWPPAFIAFSLSADCFATAASTARKELVSIEKSTLAPAVKARRLASTRKRIESAEDLRRQAAVNVARSFLRSWIPLFRW